MSLGDDIGQAVVDDQLDLDIQIFRQEILQLRPYDGFDRVVGGRDPDRASGSLSKLVQGLNLRLYLLEPWPDRVKQALARFCRGDATCGARQETNAEPC